MGAGSPGFGRDELATRMGSTPAEAEGKSDVFERSRQWKPQDATDFATELAVDTVGPKDIARQIAGSGTIVRRWSAPPGGVRKAAFGAELRIQFLL